MGLDELTVDRSKLPSGILDNEGDLIVGDKNVDPTNLTPGADGDVFQISGSQPTFAPSPAGGAWSKASTVEITSSTAGIEFTDLANVNAIVVIGADKALDTRFSFDGGSTFSDTSNYIFYKVRARTDQIVHDGSTSSTEIELQSTFNTDGAIVYAFNFSDSSSTSCVYCTSLSDDELDLGGGIFDSFDSRKTAGNAIRFIKTFSKGKFIHYKIK